VECEVLTPGQLGSRRHINLPGVKVSLPALTSKDLADIAVGLEVGVDFIALSFVREAKDILQLRAVISGAKRPPQIVAKIEDQEAIRNLDAIVAEADAIMVARGDLGIECPYEELPIIQRRIAKTCMHVGKPFIIATHMLESMIENPHPTRAEVTDVANAVYEQADAIMLSGETTVGKQPLKCIEVMDKIACRIERSGSANFQDRAQLNTDREKLVKSAVIMANELKAEGILVFTYSGKMARHTAWMRPRHCPIYVACETEEVAQSLALNWGVEPKIVAFDHILPEHTINSALTLLKNNGLLTTGNTAVVIGAVSTGTEIIDAVQMRKID
jgi:pyruvate kinase